MMKFITAIAALSMLGLVACQQNEPENEIEDAFEETADEIGDAVDEAADEVEDAADDLEDSANPS